MTVVIPLNYFLFGFDQSQTRPESNPTGAGPDRSRPEPDPTGAGPDRSRTRPESDPTGVGPDRSRTRPESDPTGVGPDRSRTRPEPDPTGVGPYSTGVLTDPVPTVDGFVNQMESKITSILDELAPLKTGHRSGPWHSINWFSPTAIEAKKRRRRLERCWKSSNEETDCLAYRASCRSANALITESRIAANLERINEA